MKKTKDQLAFERMKKPQQRVAIAIDALKHIALGVYKPVTGCYIAASDEPRHLNQATVASIKWCEVCQQGAILCSAIRLGNRMDLDLNNPDDEGNFGRYPGAFFKGLTHWFSSEQLYLMECAFERQLIPPSRENTETYKLPTIKERRVAMQFGGKYESNEHRMMAILANIIAHDGEFRP